MGTSGELGGNPEGLFHGSGHVGGAEMNSVSEVEFESATLTVRQRKEKPGEPWYAFLRYYVQTGTNEDGTPVMSRKQMAHRLVGAATRKGATAAANEWVAQLRNEQAAARAVVAERRAEEERKAEELRKAEEEEKAVRLHGYLLSYLASRDDLEPSTILDMKACISRIIRTTEDVPLKDFSRQMAKEWRKSMDSRYAYNTVKKTYNVFFAAMSAAYADGLVPANVVDAAAVTNSREKKRRKFAYQSKDNYLDKENRTILLSELDRMEDCSTKTAAILALYTGMRRAEICALTWRDVDFGRHVIHVRHSIGIADGGSYIKFPKSVSSIRPVPLEDAEEVGMLRRWERHQKALYAEAFSRASVVPGFDFEDTFVLGDPTIWARPEYFPKRLSDGSVLPAAKKAEGFLSPNTLERRWLAFVSISSARGVLGKRPTFHNLRHTYASYSANETHMPVETLAQTLGHSNISTTQRYYIAEDEEEKIRNAQEAGRMNAESGVVRKQERRGDVVQYKATGTDGQ